MGAPFGPWQQGFDCGGVHTAPGFITKRDEFSKLKALHMQCQTQVTPCTADGMFACYTSLFLMLFMLFLSEAGVSKSKCLISRSSYNGLCDGGFSAPAATALRSTLSALRSRV